MLTDEVCALEVVPSIVAPNSRPRTAVGDRALKPWRLMTDAEKEVSEARQRAGTCYKYDEAGNAIKNCPREALDGLRRLREMRLTMPLIKPRYMPLTTPS